MLTEPGPPETPARADQADAPQIRDPQVPTSPGSGAWLGVDLGGTHTKAVLLREGRVVERAQSDTVRNTPALTVDGLAGVVGDWVTRFPEVDRVGITIPGLFDDAGRAVLVPNLPGDWSGVPVTEPVERRCGRRVVLINDARAFGLAEVRLGAAVGAASAVGVVLGTGIGGFVALGGQLHEGAEGGAGEIGHVVLVPDGPQCGCGNRGCLEALARSGAIAEAAGCASLPDAAQRARAGDPVAIAAFQDAGRHMGHALAMAATLLQPETIVLGGGVLAAQDLLLPSIHDAVERLAPLAPGTARRIVVGRFGAWAGAVGAAVRAQEWQGVGRCPSSVEP